MFSNPLISSLHLSVISFCIMQYDLTSAAVCAAFVSLLLPPTYQKIGNCEICDLLEIHHTLLQCL